MHDLQEGVYKTDLVFLLKHFIVNLKSFTVTTLNKRISVFITEIADKNLPLPIFMDDLLKEKLPLSTSETLFLVRYLPIYIAYFIPKGNIFWKHYEKFLY